MIPTKILAATALGLAAAACSSSTTTYETRPAGAYAISSSEQACLDYGFRAGTDAYNRCVSREATARAQGRMPATYAMANLTADAHNACYSYGLTPGTTMYDRCVGREIDARRYRDQAYYPATTYPAPAYPATTYPTSTTYYASGYPASTTTVTYTPAPAYPPAVTPPAGVEAFRDEYGFRYDGQGNRLDRYGNIISPQSTAR